MKDEIKPQLNETLRWALDISANPAMASADWLAADIDPGCNSALDLLVNSTARLSHLRQAKNAFKTMRIVGETSADRRVGARFYAASIAAALVSHEKRISSQSDEALKRAFKSLLDDAEMPEKLRDLAGSALCALDGRSP